MREKQLISESLNRAKLKHKNGIWLYKVPDPSRCAQCGFIATASKRPFDVVGVMRMEALAIEFKTTRLKDITDHQLANLRLFDMAGGTSLAVIDDEVFHFKNGQFYTPDSQIIRELFR